MVFELDFKRVFDLVGLGMRRRFSGIVFWELERDSGYLGFFFYRDFWRKGYFRVKGVLFCVVLLILLLKKRICRN